MDVLTFDDLDQGSMISKSARDRADYWDCVYEYLIPKEYFNRHVPFHLLQRRAVSLGFNIVSNPQDEGYDLVYGDEVYATIYPVDYLPKPQTISVRDFVYYI